ncbi:MAG: discoidin domain-containing protein [Vicinamibacteraceae bacterium]|nr:discoidin domain-containing protein [Vicinamibacteraceae bacterium]
MKARLGEPAEERWSVRTRRVRQRRQNSGTTTHVIEPAAGARFVRLNVTRPSYSGEPVARIYEVEVYGPKGGANLALHRPATGSIPCSETEGPEKAVNGSVAGGHDDKWCAEDWPLFLQVDLGAVRPVARVVVKHASAGGEDAESDTRDFNIQVSDDGKTFTTVASSTGAGLVEERTEIREVVYFDGQRRARLLFIDGALQQRSIRRLLDLEEDRMVFAGIFQYFYLRLAIFFGCLGIFMYLFRGEMSNRTLHFWFLAPARREVLLAGKYAAGLMASAAIFAGGAVVMFAAMLWPHDPVEIEAYWNAGGLSHGLWYAAAAALGCVGYGSVFLAVGLYVRNPIIPAAVLLAWEGVNGILPHALQKMSILYYLQSLCPVPAPMDAEAPMLIQLLAAPAAPASRPGALLGLLLLTGVVLWIAALAVRRMQISYGAET